MKNEIFQASTQRFYKFQRGLLDPVKNVWKSLLTKKGQKSLTNFAKKLHHKRLVGS